MPEVFKINNIDYECEFKLSNPDGQEIKFTKSAIRGMTIIDNFFDPFYNCSVSIANPYDFIEDQYLLRGDGRDEFSIMFKPVKGNDDEKFEHIFVVVDDKNYSNPNVRSENIKTFILTDKNAVKFSDTIPYSKKYSGKIGDILKEIFIEVLGEELVDKDKFEAGDFQLNYIPPSTFRYIDLINYLMHIYYAKDGDIHVKSFIEFDTKTKKYKLSLLSKIFEDNKKNLLEAFALGDLTDKINTSNPNNPPPDAQTGEFIGPMKNLGYSTPLYEWNNDYFINSLVYGYDPILGEQKIKKLKIDDIKKKWTKKFVDVFKSIAGKPKPFLVTNKTTENKYKRYKFPYSVEDSVNIVEAELYNALTFYNLQASFSNIGDSKRTAGKFIDIYKTKEEILKSDEKILGRWFITEIHHTFYADLYTNEIFCTKTYVGPNSKIKEDAE